MTIENNATDRTNLIRDVEENTEQIDEIIDYIVEVEEEGGETIDEIYTTLDDLEGESTQNLKSFMMICRAFWLSSMRL